MPLKPIKIKHRLDKIKMDPKQALKAANNLIKGRWPEAEPTIMKDAASAYYYAYNVLQKRWPAAEKMILNSAYAAAYKKNFSHLFKKT